MNDEFHWRNELRKLGGPVQPVRDLWSEIDQRLDTPRRRLRLAGMAVAASVAVVCLTSLVVFRILPRALDTTVVPSHVAALAHDSEMAPASRTALAWAVPDNPALAAAAYALDDASAQLQHALEQHPDAVFLVGLLNRTNAQRMRLLREPFAG